MCVCVCVCVYIYIYIYIYMNSIVCDKAKLMQQNVLKYMLILVR